MGLFKKSTSRIQPANDGHHGCWDEKEKHKLLLMNMGYGFLRAIYGQKARRPYAYLKGLYGEQLEKHLKGPHIASGRKRTFSDAEWKTFKEEVKNKVRKENRQRVIAMIVSLVATLIFMFALVWLVRKWFEI